MMGDTSFLNALMNFPKEQITDETVELLQPYFQAPDFNFESAKKASGNVAGLCNWAEAMCTYHDVAKVVEPKIATLRGAEAELKVATKEKNAAEERMAIVQGKLDEMQVCYTYKQTHICAAAMALSYFHVCMECNGLGYTHKGPETSQAVTVTETASAIMYTCVGMSPA